MKIKCPKCDNEFELTREQAASAMGRVTSDAKAEAVRNNGRKGGRPVGSKDSRPRVRKPSAQ